MLSTRAPGRGLLPLLFLGLCVPAAHAAPAKKKPSPEVAKKSARSEKPSAKKAEKPSAKATRKRGLPALTVSTAARAKATSEETRDRSLAPGRRGRRAKAPREPKVDRFPPMKLEAVNTKEKLTLRLYDKRGRAVKASVRRLWHLMRCHQTQLERPIHWRLIRQLYRVSRRYPGKTIQIFSGLRARRVAALPNSNHIKGRAVDFHIAGVSNTALRDFLLQSCRPCGVGYYPNGLFVHLDVRERQSAFWVDYSAKGEKSEYASNPYQVLRGEKNGAKVRKESGSAAAARKISPASRPAAEAPDPEPPPEAEPRPEVAKPEKPSGDSADADRVVPARGGPPSARRTDPADRNAPPAL
jgi:uncharacterized protein YcbK (DUF882 family)